MPVAAEPILLQNVWKLYGKTTALAGLSLAVPPGSIFGFLGPNGAGKSTAIRILLGLQRPSRGTVSLFGHQLPEARVEMLRRIGSMVESPSPYLHLTGRENLEVHTRLLGMTPGVIDEALDAVNLLPMRDRLVRHYSTGMKQRLGIAIALLGDPDLLVLDEPTNGLDPAGIHEVRALVRDLPRRRAVTVFLSSHLLAEVEQVATHLAIISRGELRFQGTLADLQTRKRAAVVAVVDRPELAMQLLAAAGYPATAADGRISIVGRENDPARINAILVNGGIAVSRLGVEQPSLEDFFLEITDSEMFQECAAR
jgi:ABC-type multidrug transport system ATPase subunit